MSTRSRGRKRRAPGQTTLLGDSKPQQRQPQHAEGAKRLPSPAQMIDAAFRRQTAMLAPAAELPEPEQRTGPERILGTPAIPDVSRAVFSPKDPNRQTGAMPALGEPYAGQPAEITPAIFKAMMASLPARESAAEPEPAPVPGTDVVLYKGPGWTRGLTPRLNELAEEMDRMVAKGLGRNVTGILTAYRHARQGVAKSARSLCAALGQPEPEVVYELLRRVEHFNATETPDQIRAALGLDTDRAAS